MGPRERAERPAVAGGPDARVDTPGSADAVDTGDLETRWRDDRETLARRTERWLGSIRLLASAWALYMVATYPSYPPAHADLLRTVGLSLVGLFLVGSALLWATMERRGYASGVRQAATLGLALDTVAVTALSFLYGFDTQTSVWILLFLLPVEGSMRFQLRGAAWTLGLGVTTYLGRAYAWEAWAGVEVDLRSAFFRMTVVALVAGLVALISAELHAQRERVTRSLDEVRRSERWRSRLVSSLAHDVRSPLATIQMQAQLLESGKLPPELAVDVVRGIARQAGRLQRLADGLLDMARSEEAALELRPRPVPVEELVRRVIDAAGIEAAVAVEPGLVATLDPDRIEQVLTNLLTNARKHGEPPLLVAGWATAAGLVLEVRDHGPGVPAEQRAGLFRAFEGNGDATSVGLGLWIVHELVRAHEGTVVVRDGDPGAIFRIFLPVPLEQCVPQDGEPALAVES